MSHKVFVYLCIFPKFEDFVWDFFIIFPNKFLCIKHKIFQATFFNSSIPIVYFHEIEDIRMHFYKQRSVVGRMYIKREIMNQRREKSRRGWMKLYGLDSLSKETFMECRMRYSPYGSIASFYLWEIAHSELIWLY